MDAVDFRKEMESVANRTRTDGYTDVEENHEMADRLLCEVLRGFGFGAGVDVFERMEKWYA
jgi:hypothetical protein